MNKINNTLLGDAGEYYVAFRLASMGINPALMSRNSKGVDILATDNGQKVISIQVKSSRGKNNPRRWDVGRHRPAPSASFFYIFLNIFDDSGENIECFVVPSNFVAGEVIWEENKRPIFHLIKNNIAQFKDNWTPIKAYLFPSQDSLLNSVTTSLHTEYST
jgi:hypothetical protein